MTGSPGKAVAPHRRDAAIPGTSQVAHLEANVASAAITLSDDDYLRLSQQDVINRWLAQTIRGGLISIEPPRF